MPLRSFWISAAAVALSGLAACASVEPAGQPAALSASAERGRSFAARACAGCHELGGGRQSANAVAPQFSSIRMRHTEIGLERTLEKIAREGHGEMPPIYMTRSEMSDLVDYIASLEPVAQVAPPRGLVFVKAS